jgi:hypothetical protein
MSGGPTEERCPSCGASGLRPKRVLVDQTWVYAPGRAALTDGLASFVSFWAEDPRHRFQQVVEGYSCQRCGHAFASEKRLEERRPHDADDQSPPFPAWEEVAVEVPWNIHVGGLTERWYRNLATGEAWRLVAPDGPFRGVWERVQ